MIKCREATRKMSEALERPLTLGEQASLTVHTAVCRPCRDFRRQVAFLRQSTRAYARTPGDDERDSSQ